MDTAVDWVIICNLDATIIRAINVANVRTVKATIKIFHSKHRSLYRPIECSQLRTIACSFYDTKFISSSFSFFATIISTYHEQSSFYEPFSFIASILATFGESCSHQSSF